MSEKLESRIRQEQIAQAAVAIVAERGLRRLSVADLARRVGLVPSAIDRHDKGKEEVLETVLRVVRDALHDIVRDGQARGVIRRELDPMTVAVMFLGLIQPAAILWQMSDGRFDVTKHADKAWPVFRNAIVAS